MNPLTLMKIAPWIIAALLGVGLLWYRGEYLSEKAAYAEFRDKAVQAVIDQKKRDEELSARLLDQQRESLNRLHAQALTSLKAVHNAPVTTACVSTPAVRAAVDGVRALLSGAGGPKAGP